MFQQKGHASIIYRITLVCLLWSGFHDVLYAMPLPSPISQLSENVCIRICCIARLKQIMGHIKTLCDNNHCTSMAVDSSLLDQWDDFASFRYISDFEFQTNFLRKAFAAAISLVNSGELAKELRKAERRALSLEQMLSLIDMCTDILMKGEVYYHFRGQFSAEQYYSKEDINAESVTRRFFQIRRMRYATSALRQLAFHKISLRGEQNKSIHSGCLSELLNHIQHPRILDAIASMIESNNSASLLAVADEMIRFRYVGDDQFFQEMLLTMFNAYKTILLRYMHDPEVQVRIGLELGTILHMYEQIDQLSLEELLEGIDMATEHMNIILNDIHMMDSSWFSRVSIYLNAAPVVIGLGVLGTWYYMR